MENSIKLNDANSFVQLALSFVDIEQDFDLEQTVLDKLKLEKLKEFLSKSATFVANRLTLQLKKEVASATKVGDVLLEIDDVQFFEPRGRFKLVISTKSLVLEGKQFSCVTFLDNISHMSCIPSNCSAKKEGEDFLAVRFFQPVKINNKDVHHILGNLSKSPLKMALSADGLRDIESSVVTKVLQNATDIKVVRPQKHLFQTIAQQKEYLRCYKGIQEGAIYPLENGVVFVKPLLFLPAEEISSLTAGRGGGAGNTRYVDLKIETVDGKEFEFTNIEREELAALNMYVKGYLEARTARERDAAGKAGGRQHSSSSGTAEVVDLQDGAQRGPPTGGQCVDEDSDESEDDDYSPGGSDDSSDSEADGSDSSDNSGSGSDSDDSGSNSGGRRQKVAKSRKNSARSDSDSDSNQGKKVKKEKVKQPAPKKMKVDAGGIVDMTVETAPLVKKETQAAPLVKSSNNVKKTVAPKVRGSIASTAISTTSSSAITITIDDEARLLVKRERSSESGDGAVCDLSGGDEQALKKDRIEIEL